MQRASETIGKIAAALALAQKQIENPEKTLSATIASPFPREGTVSFRYASLAKGLEIIRKALSEHEIATVQRTEIDKELGLIRLNTVLAHSSGEWIASDWPVCATADIAAPHRLGTALTYARRYALFALVGIAGEDDLDAPDLPVEPAQVPGRVGAPAARRVKRERIFPIVQSEETKRKLIDELDGIGAVEELMLWAIRRLPLKNRLQDADAAAVEVTYSAKLQRLGEAPVPPEGTVGLIGAEEPLANGSNSSSPVLLPKTSRVRDKRHLTFVAAQPCLVCQRTPCDAHHLRFAQPRSLGRKVSDQFTVPLCRSHHEELHRTGNELSWWANIGISPLDDARELWRVSRERRAARRAHAIQSDASV